MSATCNPTCFVLGTKMKLRAFDAEKFSALLHVLSQTPTRRHTARFGGKTPKADDPTGVDWNGTTINERERVGIADIRRFQAPDLHRQVRSFSFGSLRAASRQPLRLHTAIHVAPNQHPRCFASAQHECGNRDARAWIFGRLMNESG